MNKKILAFVSDGKKFLILRNNFKDPTHGGDYWFTVTGSMEKKESKKEAIKREIKEETNLDVKEIVDLNWASIYSWNGQDHKENNFLAFAKKGKIILNKEHIDFEWLELDNFVERINWGSDKNVLKKVLEKALKGEIIFKKEKIDDFRKKSLGMNSENRVWRGVILEESLEDKSLLSLVKIVGTKKEKLEGENRFMTFHKIEVKEKDKDKFIHKVVKSIKYGFYTHLVKEGVMYVVFKGHMYKFSKGFPELEMAKDEGRKMGIPEEQMPFEHLVDHPFD